MLFTVNGSARKKDHGPIFCGGYREVRVRPAASNYEIEKNMAGSAVKHWDWVCSPAVLGRLWVSAWAGNGESVFRNVGHRQSGGPATG